MTSPCYLGNEEKPLEVGNIQYHESAMVQMNVNEINSP